MKTGELYGSGAPRRPAKRAKKHSQTRNGNRGEEQENKLFLPYRRPGMVFTRVIASNKAPGVSLPGVTRDIRLSPSHLTLPTTSYKPLRSQFVSPLLLRLTVLTDRGSGGVPSSLPLAGCVPASPSPKA